MTLIFRTFFIATVYIICVYAACKVQSALADPSKTAYNIRQGRIRQRNVEYTDAIGISEAATSSMLMAGVGSEEEKICKNKGRLSMLFNFAIKWKPNADQLLVNNGAEEILSSPRQLLKPCPSLITVRPRRVDYFGRT